MILLAFGTRPEFLKLKLILNMFKKNNIEYKILFTGQHVDLLKNVFFNQRIFIKDKKNRLESIVSSIMNKIDFTGINYVLVQGDTTSAMGVGLAAFYNKIPLIHLESGLRTYNKENPYPEEINRRIISNIADIHFCPTELARQNLLNEKVNGKIYVVGNTVIDNLLEWKYKCEYTNKILITLHRRENHYCMKEWFLMINEIAKHYQEYEFIFPVHPNPSVQICKKFINAENIKLIEPLEHDELLDILVKTRLVISDSGGIQEECSFFNKICLTCRKVTERPEAIGKSTILVESPFSLPEVFEKYIDNYKINYVCPFGDGHSSEKIVKILKEEYKI